MPPDAAQLEARVNRAKLAGRDLESALRYNERNDLGLDVSALREDYLLVVAYDDWAALARLGLAQEHAEREGMHREGLRRQRQASGDLDLTAVRIGPHGVEGTWTAAGGDSLIVSTWGGYSIETTDGKTEARVSEQIAPERVAPVLRTIAPWLPQRVIRRAIAARWALRRRPVPVARPATRGRRNRARNLRGPRRARAPAREPRPRRTGSRL